MEKKPYHHGNLEETLIEAGITLISEEGYDHLSLRRIATACEVSHAAPYKHFQNKEELLLAMADHIEIRFSNQLIQSYEGASDKEDGMICMALAYLNFFLENPHYFNFFQRFQGNFRINLNDMNEESGYRPFEVFKNAALHDLSHLPLTKDSQRETIIAMWSVVHGFTAIAVMNGVIYDGDRTLLLKSILNNNLTAGGNHFEK